MPKVKTSSGAKKRFKVTGAGLLTRRDPRKRHHLSHTSPTRSPSVRKDEPVAENDTKRIKRLLGMR